MKDRVLFARRKLKKAYSTARIVPAWFVIHGLIYAVVVKEHLKKKKIDKKLNK
jgi:hypothetical protein